MKSIAAFVLTLLCATNAQAYSVKIGDQPTSIPSPYGFIRTDDRLTNNSTTDKTTNPTKGITRTIWFTQFDNEPESSKDEFLETKNKCNLMIDERYSDISFDQKKFEEFKNIIFRDIENRRRGNVHETDSGYLAKDIDLKLREIHDTSRNVFLSSYIARIHHSKEKYKNKFSIGSITTAYVLVNEKVVQINCMSLGNNTEWTKSTALSWANSIVDTNKKYSSNKTKEHQRNWRYDEEFYQPLGTEVYTAKLSSTNTVHLRNLDSERTKLAIEIMGTSQSGVIVLSTSHGELSCINECRVSFRFDKGNDYDFKFRPFDDESTAINISPSEQSSLFRKLKSSSNINIEVEYKGNGLRRFEFNSGNLIWNHYDFSD